MDRIHPHIEILREPDIEGVRRSRRQNPPPQSMITDRGEHARRLIGQTSKAERRIIANRQKAGVNSENLIVIELQRLDRDHQNVLEKRFEATVLEILKDEHVTMLVMFRTREALEDFRAELNAYSQGAESERVRMPVRERERFFDLVMETRARTRDDRIGPRLREKGFPTSTRFGLDLDLWHPGEDDAARQLTEELRSMCGYHECAITDNLRTDTLLLTRINATVDLTEKLLELDFVATVDLTPELSPEHEALLTYNHVPDMTTSPSEDTPRVCVVDSGVISGHPMLQGWIIEEEDFDSGEESVSDRQGHGTAIAGLVVYGRIAECIRTGEWVPKVAVCSAKVLRRGEFDNTEFADEKRIESQVDRAIRYFHKEQDCRIFNLSLGNSNDVYRGRRQSAWAELLDQLSRELDIVFVVSAGNCDLPNIHELDALQRREAQEQVRDLKLDDDNTRIISPASSALAITVGSVASSERARAHDAILSSAPEGMLTGFSRIGPGIRSTGKVSGVKPEVVAPGGNSAFRQHSRPTGFDIYQGEPSLSLPGKGRLVGAFTGTSFAAPQVSHAAALAYAALKQVSDAEPSANLIRAMVGIAASTSDDQYQWHLDSGRKETDDKLRMIGYGEIDQTVIERSADNDIILYSEDALPLDEWRVFTIPLPEAFFEKGKRGVTISLAYNPPIRANRMEYLARTMWLESLKDIEADEVLLYKHKNPDVEHLESLPSRHKVKMLPPHTKLQWSTLQVRRTTWVRRPGLQKLTILIGCQKRFDADSDPQDYAIAVRLWHECESVQMYQQIQQNVRLRQPIRLVTRG